MKKIINSFRIGVYCVMSLVLELNNSFFKEDGIIEIDLSVQIIKCR